MNQILPYSGLIQCFSQMINQILSQKEECVEYYREKLSSILGVNSQLMIELIPELELILGKQSEKVEDLPAGQNEVKRYYIISSFSRKVTTSHSRGSVYIYIW